MARQPIDPVERALEAFAALTTEEANEFQKTLRRFQRMEAARPKSRRGRPPGSKNAQKAPETQEATPAA
ncbi:MAG: hypothetical protein GY906_22735 [bacterium]|nr:hypothetical protein [bacterium]